jgi:predicted secreted protein
MNWFTGIVVFLITWWMVFFTVLPWGNRPPEHPETGHADSAPERPRIFMKMLVTTGITALLFGIIWYVIDLDIISFRYTK